jgi:pimeloyl-ACP methyl ester carboxylesterase
MSQSSQTVSVVLVHGAWADGSSWSNVIRPLQSRGLHVIAPPLPLTSLSDDVKALDHALERTTGPVILGAHAYSGAVISATANDRVKGLVFIASLTPDAGETVADVFYRENPHPKAPQLAPDSHGFIWMPDEAFPTAFAQNASAEQAALFAATQHPISVACIQEKAPQPLWKQKPSWYLVAESDRMINPKTQHFLAERMRAKVRVENVDHAPIATAPHPVIELFLEAVGAV